MGAQVRKSGEPYITHPVEVTRILAELKMDAESLIAGLLHDTVEDTQAVSFDEIEVRPPRAWPVGRAGCCVVSRAQPALSPPPLRAADSSAARQMWFGSAVRRIVEGETKFSKIAAISGGTSRADAAALDLRQLFLAMTEEVRAPSRPGACGCAGAGRGNRGAAARGMRLLS